MKKRSYSSYLVTACIVIVVISLISDFLLNEPGSAVKTKAAKTAPIISIDKSRHLPHKVQKEAATAPLVLEETGELQSDDKIEIEEKSPRTLKPVAPYKVVFQYPTQHVFDDNLCNLDKIQENYKPQRNKAVQRLGSLYTHDYFELNEYLKLNLYSVNASNYFKQELSARVLQLHKNYRRLLGRLAEKEMTINLIVLPTRNHYLQHIAYFSDKISNSLGVYFGGLNLAFVDYQGTDDKALKTSLHETVHVLNAHIIGRTPNMFNEGMAEFYENINVKNGQTHFNESEHRISKQAYPISLFFDNEQWQYLNTSQLYYSSWLWMRFMHTNTEGIGALIYFMQKEQEDPCSYLSADESYSLFQEAYNVFETDFNEVQEELPEHQE